MTRLQTLLDTLARIRVITPADVIALRQAVFGGDAIVSMAEAQMLIELDDATVTRAPEWRAFYTEALTDYLVRQQPPIGYVDEVGTAWLIGALQRDGAVRAESAL